jgi:hypothetical protein
MISYGNQLLRGFALATLRERFRASPRGADPPLIQKSP